MSAQRDGRVTTRTLAIIFAAAFAVLAPGCATYVKHLCHNIAPSSTLVTIESTPPGATAKLSNGRTATTPASLVLRSDEPVTVAFTKEGYRPAEVKFGPGVSYWFLGDLIALPPLGFFIDAEQGAVSRTCPSAVHVRLESAGGPASTLTEPAPAPTDPSR